MSADQLSSEQMSGEQLSGEQLTDERACAGPVGVGPSTSPMAIGEVLAALRSDFPDITVSKIRFLDGAGLVSPQRSGSGYRRFSDADLLRLRQVLVLQRDHYLPLKVIRAHIAAGTLDRALVEVARPPVTSSPRSVRDRSEGASADTSPEPPAAPPAPGGGLPALPASGGGPPTSHASGGSPTRTAPAADSAPGPVRGPVRERAPLAPPAGPPVAHGTPVLHGTSVPHGTPAARAVGAGSPSPGPRAFAGHPRRLRVEDLLRLSGLPIETLTELETAGLLRSRNGWYHAEDLAVAVAAAQLAAHGIGPRHLRSLRNGADRELGLLEQSLVPLLRRARPDARTRAEDTARTLRELYAQVHTALVTAGLRDLGIDPR